MQKNKKKKEKKKKSEWNSENRKRCYLSKNYKDCRVRGPYRETHQNTNGKSV